MLLRNKLLGAAAALAIGMTPIAAGAVELTFFHTWSNDSEMAALNAILTPFAATGNTVKTASVPHETAASLLTDASAARRAGETDRAIALYRRLENEFPKSPEAGLAALPLGGLLLDRGEARAALAEFDRHVRGGQSRLLPEALYGRGRSLAALGNRGEERRTWARLLDQFPQSPYAGHARRRLAELPSVD